ncbi:MAG: D-cysteine desulfhydrase family protein [Bdellovibrionales bacterium]|nr:D-cysteine desulfhydrase family protein [Bdellovibrionales bacterium]
MSFEQELAAKDRVELAFLPTPLHELPALADAIGGPRLFIKRDDQTGLATGGNKTRKLEFLIADAIKLGADTVITAGAPQSNHCRQTAAAAARYGLNCELVLGGPKPEVPNGNLLLDIFFGASLNFTEKARRNQVMREVADELRRKGENPYIIPVGGSNGIGALGYIDALIETCAQLDSMNQKIDRILFATSSGGTQAGLALGAKLSGCSSQILGISVDQEKLDGRPYQQELVQITGEAAACIGVENSFSIEDFDINYEYLGAGYGVVGDLERNAINLLAKTEGILLDPVYAGRAFGGMLDLIAKGEIGRDENILFWHTGGSSALFAYAQDLVD